MANFLHPTINWSYWRKVVLGLRPPRTHNSAQKEIIFWFVGYGLWAVGSFSGYTSILQYTGITHIIGLWVVGHGLWVAGHG